ncbi:MAG: Hsp20/alpha crystallin family protein [Firmicutes bacterium]|nr:Hsp20/alpha crystallin family protein [Bacillota bacterium]
MSLQRWEPGWPWRRYRHWMAPFLEPWDDDHLGAAWGPSVDLRETREAFVLSADIPGVDPDRVEITVHPNSVVLRGEVANEHNVERDGYRLQERRRGAFYRTVALPGEVRPNEATADYQNGVLEITLPKVTPSQNEPVRLKIRRQTH